MPADCICNVDTVFHLAGKVHTLSEEGHGEAEYRRVNVDGTRELLESSAINGVQRFVYFSSVKATREGGNECYDEAAAGFPKTPYARSKLASEDLVLKGAYVSHATVLRPSMVYGPGMKGNLERMIRAIATGRFPPLPEVGNRRSMVHVEDVVNAAMLVVVKPQAAGRVYHVTDGHEYSTRQIYEWVCEVLGKAVPSWTMPLALPKAFAALGDRIGRIRGRRCFLDTEALEKLLGSACYSPRRIEQELGFRPQRELQGSLLEIVSAMGLSPT